MQESIARLFEYILLGVTGAGIVGIIMAGLYDMQAAARRQSIDAVARKLRRKSARPQLTVIVYAYNDSEMIAGCLEALRRSAYKKYDLVVVDNASHDRTRQVVRAFMREHPRFVFRFYAKRKHSPLSEALRLACKKSRQAEFVVTLAASSRPSRDFLTVAVARFIAEPGLAGFLVSERPMSLLTITGVVPEVVRSLQHAGMKSLSLLKVQRAQVNVNGAYRYRLIVNQVKTYVRYEGSLALPTVHYEQQSGIVEYKLLLVLPAVTTLLFMTYAMTLAASLVSSQPLFASWLVAAVGSLVFVWSDERMPTMQKIQLTFAAPLVYFLLYVALLRFALKQIVNSAVALPRIVLPRFQWYFRRRTIS